MRAELGQPGRIGDIALATREVLHMPGIDQHHLDAGQVFEEVVAQIQDWVTTAKYQGLSPRSIKKYHVLLSSILPDADQRNLDALDRITHRRE